MCQEFVASALECSREKFDQAYNVHYMFDMLLSHPDLGALQDLLAHVLEQFQNGVLW
jgi:hypothetical protein